MRRFWEVFSYGMLVIGGWLLDERIEPLRSKKYEQSNRD